jgi:hypothetical protein
VPEYVATKVASYFFAAGTTAYTATYVATYIASTYVISSVAQSLNKQPSSGMLESGGQTVTTREPIAPRRIVYGRTRIGGNIVFLESTNLNSYLHMVIVLTGHEIDAIEKFYFNDQEVTIDGSGNVTSSNYSGVARIQYKLGTSDQTAFSSLVSESDGLWTNNHRLRGCAALYVRLKYDQDKYPNGVPNITCLVRGKKVYDPRTATTAWSANPALCISDYLTNTEYGLKETYATGINETALIAAANVCDEDVNVAGGTTENRYEMHGVFDTAVRPEDILNQMVNSMAGKLVWANGTWRILAGAYETPTITFDEDDLRGGFRIQTLISRREAFNAVKGVFQSPLNNYVSSDFPPVTSALFVAQDNNEQTFKNIELPFTTSSPMAQRIAKIDLLRARQQITVTMPMKLTALKANVGDIVYINNSRMGWSNKPFEVVSSQLSFEEILGVDLGLREISTDVYDWSTSEESSFDAAPNTNLPDPFDVIAPGVSATDVLEINSETIITKLVVTVSGEHGFQDRYEVQAKQSTETDYRNLGQATGNIFELPNVIDGAVYNVRARTINALGVRSAWTTTNHEVVGKTAPPQDVSDFSINIVETQAYLTWTPVTDLDLSHYRIRHARETVGATYSNAVDLIAKVPRPGVFAIAPAMTGTYFIKAIDKLGNESINATSIVAIIESIKDLNAIETVTESPSFTGAKTECHVTDEGLLVLDTSIDFDSATGLFDDAEGDFDGGGGTTSTEGTYTFANVVDLGAVYTSRVTVNANVGRIDYVNLFDDVAGNFDDREGLFDGDPNTYGDSNVQFYISTTEDDPNAAEPTWTAYRKFFVGDYKARGLRFKAILTTTSVESSPSISNLSVSVDMPDRVASGDDLTSGAGSYGVTFSPAFKATPAIGIAAQNLAQGDYYEITAKSASGFTITFKDSGGSPVSRTFDYVAKGYGELAA